jgi:hypothetical protein
MHLSILYKTAYSDLLEYSVKNSKKKNTCKKVGLKLKIFVKALKRLWMSFVEVFGAFKKQ